MSIVTAIEEWPNRSWTKPRPNGEPVRRWHSMQWQAMMMAGASGNVSEIAPQLHSTFALATRSFQ